MVITLRNVQKAEAEGEMAQCGNALLKKKQGFEMREKYLVGPGMCVSEERLLGALGCTATWFSVGDRHDRMTVELLGEKELRSLQRA